MKYNFPVINSFEQVSKVVRNVDGFFINEKDFGWVITYTLMGSEIFPEVITHDTATSTENAIRRECRGIAFDKTGNVISRPFHKFFNLNEKEECHINQIDISRPHVILEKIDGSMIRPIPIGDGYRLATKAGVTDVSMQAEVFVAGKPNYHSFIMDMLSKKITPIFEWCSRKQRIVIDYPVEKLVLIATRQNNTGEYASYDQLVSWGHKYGLDVVKTYPGTVTSMQNLAAETRELKGQEGWVVRFNDGHMVKIKADEYVAIHRAKENIFFEKNIIDLFISEKIDDVIPFLLDEDKARIKEFQSKFWFGINDTVNNWVSLYTQIRNRFGDDRKAFALEMAPNLEPITKTAMFWAWSKNNTFFLTFIMEHIKKNLGSQSSVDSVRVLWGHHTWAETGGVFE